MNPETLEVIHNSLDINIHPHYTRSHINGGVYQAVNLYQPFRLEKLLLLRCGGSLKRFGREIFNLPNSDDREWTNFPGNVMLSVFVELQDGLNLDVLFSFSSSQRKER